MNPSKKTSTARHDIEITLGAGWQRFAFATPGLTFLGTIRRAMEIGALAWDDAGAYWQVNGDIQQALNKSRMEAHLRKAGFRPAPAAQADVSTGPERNAVSVVVKRRRRVLLP